ncbi:hypothetical protein LB505_009830 [Fusarium chuoi]|nr:hypothetical protein LB505_009830 [Fusarium chuoi]
MFALPLTQLYSLGLQPKKKAGVMVIFGVGIFLIAASCIRIPYLLDFTRTLNASCRYYPFSPTSYSNGQKKNSRRTRLRRMVQYRKWRRYLGGLYASHATNLPRYHSTSTVMEHSAQKLEQ